MLCLADNIDLIKRQNEELQAENELLKSKNQELENNLIELLESVALMSEETEAEKEVTSSEALSEQSELYNIIAQMDEDIALKTKELHGFDKEYYYVLKWDGQISEVLKIKIEDVVELGYQHCMILKNSAKEGVSYERVRFK